MLELLDLRDRRERLEPRHFETPPAVADPVRDILRRVRDEGDAALLDLTERFDGAELREFGLVAAPAEFAGAIDLVPQELRHAIDGLIDRVADLSRRQLPREWHEERNGVRFGEIVRPIRAAGCYVPGGRAAYPSSVCMTVTPAVVAGVEEIVVCTPPRSDGSFPPAVLYAAAKAGATRVVKVGGAQAIGALAYGTDVGSRRRPDRRTRQRLRDGGEAPARSAWSASTGSPGRRELVHRRRRFRADPRWLAADLVAQAEHDPEALSHACHERTADLGRRGGERARGRGRNRADRREIVEQALAARAARCSSPTSTHAVEVVERPRARAPPADRSDRRTRDARGEGSGAPGRSSSATSRRCRSATTASRRTTCCRPRAPRGSRAACAPPTSSRSRSVVEMTEAAAARARARGRRDRARRGPRRPRSRRDDPRRAHRRRRRADDPPRTPAPGSPRRRAVPAHRSSTCGARLNTNECPYPLPEAVPRRARRGRPRADR